MKFPKTQEALIALSTYARSSPWDIGTDMDSTLLQMRRAVGRAYAEDTGYDLDACEKAVRPSPWLTSRIFGKPARQTRISKRFTPGTVLRIITFPVYVMDETGKSFTLPWNENTGSEEITVVSCARTGPDRALITFRWRDTLVTKHQFLEEFRSYKVCKA